METQIVINWTNIIIGIFSAIIGIFGFFIVRIVKGYDSQIKELFERTKNLPAIETDIEWIKKEMPTDKK